jgi:hypothetical protein
MTLFHTLYRYFVLLGFPGQKGHDDTIETVGADLCDNAVWRAAAKLLVPSLIRGDGKQRGRPSAIVKQFAADQAMFSLAFGTAPVIVRARERMQQVTGMTTMIRQMLAYTPSSRPTMLQLLQSAPFSYMRQSVVQPEAAVAVVDVSKQFMAFHRGSECNHARELLDV